MKLTVFDYEYDSTESKQKNAENVTYKPRLLVDASQEHFTKYVHSHHWWAKGRSGGELVKTHGIIFDIDNENWEQRGKFTAKDIKELFAGFKLIIYSSQNHLKVKPKYENDGEVDRFHVYLPFSTPIEYDHDDPRMSDPFDKVYDHILKITSARIDTSCKDLGRILFGSVDNENAFYEEVDGKLFNWETDATLGEVAPAPVKKNANNTTIKLDDEVRLAKPSNRRVMKKIRDIEGKTSIFCPICDDENSDGASAFVGCNSGGIPFIFCSHCSSVADDGNGTYWLDPKEANELTVKAGGMLAFSQKSQSGCWIRYQDGTITKKEKEHIQSHFRDQGLFPPNTLSTYEVIKDFSTDEIYVSEDETTKIKTINTYLAPKLLRDAKADPTKTSADFPIINSLIGHVFPVAYERDWFEQWLNGVFCRRRLRTTFLIIGDPGCGKNILFEEVVGRVVGINATVTISNELLKKEFNTYLQAGVFYVYDEVAIGKEDRVSIREKIKKFITNPRVSIEGKGTNSENNYRMTGNCVFLSNNDVPMQIDDKDRRFNVVRSTPGNITSLPWYTRDLTPQIEAELPAFVSYILAKHVIHDVDNDTFMNEEKERLIGAVKTVEQQFFDALYECDASYFIETQTPLERFDTRESFTTAIDRNGNSLENDLKRYKARGYILPSELNDLTLRLWGKIPRNPIKVRNPLPPFKRSTRNGVKVIAYPN